MRFPARRSNSRNGKVSTVTDEPKKQRCGWQSLTAVYATMLPHLQRIAREQGYSLAVHGSMAHDLDLIACPWTEEASDPEALIEALRASINGAMVSICPGVENPCYKPHGRRAWSIYFRETEVGWGPYLDISVMPRLPGAGVEILHEFPEIGEDRLCLLCGYRRPWGLFDQVTGVCVCIECRDKAKRVC